MPIIRGIDVKGPYFQYGNQKRYYYEKGNKKSRDEAKEKATRQRNAIKRSRNSRYMWTP